MVISCLLPASESNTYDTAMTTAVTAVPLAGMLTVEEDRFATMPALKAVSAPITTTYRPFDEEELHTSFEQAISERVLAVKKMLNQHSHALPAISTPLPLYMTATRTAPMKLAAKAVVKLVQPRGKTLSHTSTHTWLRGLTYASFALMLILIGFDLMGILVLFAR